MVSGKVRIKLTDEEILSRATEYDIYRYFMREDFKVGKVMHSPMPGRKDNHPSFIIGARGGFYYHQDFADSRYKGNCFHFVMQKEMLPCYNDALLKIDKEMGLGILNIDVTSQKPVFVQPKIENSKPRFFQVDYSKNFSLEEERYWNSFYISKDECIANEIFPIRKYWLDRKLQPMRKTELCFGYKLDSLWKIYRPFAERERKWIGNVPNSAMEGMDCINSTTLGVISKSRKDRVVLQKFLNDVVSTQNESLNSLALENVEDLNVMWKNIYVAFDSDKPGKENSLIVTQKYGWRHLNTPDYLLPHCKDFASMIQLLGPQAVEQFLKSKRII